MRALLLVLLVAGCATPPSQIRPDAGSAEYQADAVVCDYESSSATAGYGSGQNTARSNSGAVSQGFATGMAQGLERRDLFTKCMRAKYVARGTTSTVTYPRPMADPTGVVSK